MHTVWALTQWTATWGILVRGVLCIARERVNARATGWEGVHVVRGLTWSVCGAVHARASDVGIRVGCPQMSTGAVVVCGRYACTRDTRSSVSRCAVSVRASATVLCDIHIWLNPETRTG